MDKKDIEEAINYIKQGLYNPKSVWGGYFTFDVIDKIKVVNLHLISLPERMTDVICSNVKISHAFYYTDLYRADRLFGDTQRVYKGRSSCI